MPHLVPAPSPSPCPGAYVSAADPTRRFALTLVDELVRCGLREAVLAPGSRSAPLAIALAEHPAVRLHVHLDERGAAFFALGAAKQTGRPVAVLCTSGTAAANFHPAVVEAFHSRAPLLVLTADRPRELRDTGANQTIEQRGLYGSALRWFCEVGVPASAVADLTQAGRWWRSVAARAWTEALGPPAGPVQLNLPLDEPLVPRELGGDPEPGRPGGAPWTATSGGWRAPTTEEVEALGALVRRAPRGLLLVPAFAVAHRPELAVRVGAGPTSKALTSWLGPDEGVPQVLLDPDNAWADPLRAASTRLSADPAILLEAAAETITAGAGAGNGEGAWRAAWMEADARATKAISELLDGWDDPFEGRIARDLAAHLPDGATLVAGSSMPVRDLDTFGLPRDGLSYVANRGDQGIDGFVATALGVAAVAPGPVAPLGGDLTFLHDATSVLTACSRRPGVTFVVVDNDGGGIFSFLPQATLPPDLFEPLFGTPHGLDLAAVARAAGLPTHRIERAADLPRALGEALAQGDGTSTVLIVPSDRATNLTRHRAATAAVAEALA